MNPQHLTKLANALVEKREKRAALWDKLLRTGQLSSDSIARIVKSLDPKKMQPIASSGQPWVGRLKGFGSPERRLAAHFPHTKRRLFGRSTKTVPAKRQGYWSLGEWNDFSKDFFDDIIRGLRKGKIPAKRYAPMNDILKQLKKPALPRSSMLDKDLFRNVTQTFKY